MVQLAYMIPTIVIFIILLAIAIPLLAKTNKRSAVSISAIVKKLAIPAKTQGFMSGHSVFTKNYVFLSDELIFIPNGHVSKAVRIRYSDIADIQLRGWVVLYFRIRTKSGKQVLSISPINRFRTLSRKNVSDIEAGRASTNELNGRSGNVIVVADTVANYMNYTAPFHDFIRALSSRNVSKELTGSIGWGWARLRRAVSTIVISIAALVLITWIVLIATNSTIKF